MSAATSVPGVVKLFLATMLLFNGVIGAMIYEQLRVLTFATTTGRVEEAGTALEESRTASGQSRVLSCPAVAYTYDVGGQTYHGDTFRKGGFCSSGHADVERILSDLEQQAAATVYYNPADPREAVLMAGLSIIDHFALLFFLPFNLFALGWVLEILSLKTLGHRLEPDVMRFGQKGTLAWARFPRIGPVKFTLGILLVVSFLLALAAGLRFQNLTDTMFGYLWPALGVFALVVFVGKALWNRLRSSTATYDARAGRLTVPGGPTLDRSQIIAWDVEEISGKADRPLYFRPRLQIRTGAGGTETVSFPTLPSHEEAYRFCDWLVRTVKLEGAAAT